MHTEFTHLIPLLAPQLLSHPLGRCVVAVLRHEVPVEGRLVSPVAVTIGHSRARQAGAVLVGGSVPAVRHEIVHRLPDGT